MSHSVRLQPACSRHAGQWPAAGRRRSRSSRVVFAVDELDKISHSRAVAVLVVIPAHRPHTHTRHNRTCRELELHL